MSPTHFRSNSTTGKASPESYLLLCCSLGRDGGGQINQSSTCDCCQFAQRSIYQSIIQSFTGQWAIVEMSGLLLVTVAPSNKAPSDNNVTATALSSPSTTPLPTHLTLAYYGYNGKYSPIHRRRCPMPLLGVRSPKVRQVHTLMCMNKLSGVHEQPWKQKHG